MSEESNKGKLSASECSSEEMLDELRSRGIDLTSEKLADKAIAFVLHTGRRIETGDFQLTEDRLWCDDAMRAYLEAVETHEKDEFE